MANRIKTSPDPELLHRRLLTISTVYAGITMAVLAPLIWLGIDIVGKQLVMLLSGLVPLMGVVVLIDTGAASWLFQPVVRTLRKIQSDQDAAGQTEMALARTLNMPVLMFGRALTLHYVSAIGLGGSMVWLLNIYGDLGLPLWKFMLFSALAFAGAAIHGVFEFLAVARLIRPIVPVLRPHCDLDHLRKQRIIPASIQQQLLVTMLCIGLVPFLLLGLVTLARFNILLIGLNVSDPATTLQPIIIWVVLLVITVVVFMGLLAVVMSRQMHWLTAQVVEAMQGVQMGDLDHKLEATTTDEFAMLYEGFNRMVDGLRERERLHDAFGRYVSPELAGQIASQGISMTGESRQASVLFCDIRNFTAMSESMPPEQVVEMLNHFFARVEPMIKAEGGWINKFLGDGFMAIFGAPVPADDHAHRAILAAMAIRSATAAFNAEQRTKGQPEIATGVGIASGEMIAGTVGSPDRLEYTVIGDAVNLASRIEALNKEFGTDILVSEEVYQGAQNGFASRPMPPIAIRGKAEKVTVYAIEK